MGRSTGGGGRSGKAALVFADVEHRVAAKIRPVFLDAVEEQLLQAAGMLDTSGAGEFDAREIQHLGPNVSNEAGGHRRPGNQVEGAAVPLRPGQQLDDGSRNPVDGDQVPDLVAAEGQPQRQATSPAVEFTDARRTASSRKR